MKIYMLLKHCIALIKPRQWLKNMLLLFPPFFGGKFFEPSTLKVLIPSLLSFSFIASCGYILNDIRDRESDRYHAVKKNRPLVRGDIPVAAAFVLAGILYLSAMFVSSSVSQQFEGFIIIYFFVSFFYTIYFKDIVLADIFLISSGFLIRVLAGGSAFHVTVSSWLFLTVFIVSLFLAAGKRLGELMTLGIDAPKHRKILAHYTPGFLEGILWISASVAIVMYALYTIENKRELIYTVPIAAYGLLRYIYIAREQGRGDPTDALLKDRQITVTGIVWFFAVAYIIYR